MAKNEEQWAPEHFTRRDYTISGPSLDKAKSIRVHVLVDGKREIDFQLREPGILAIVSRPDEQGITVELVEPSSEHVTDMDGDKPGQRRPRPWQLSAILDPKG